MPKNLADVPGGRTSGGKWRKGKHRDGGGAWIHAKAFQPFCKIQHTESEAGGFKLITEYWLRESRKSSGRLPRGLSIISISVSLNFFCQIDWPRYISKMIYPPRYGKAITKEKPLLCMFMMATCSEYLRELRSLVNDSGTRTVANYLGWRWIMYRWNLSPVHQ